MRTRAIRWLIAAVVVIALWVFMGLLPNLYLNWLWFGDVHYRQVFWGILLSRVTLGVVFGGAFFVLVMFNAWLARRLAPKTSWYEAESRFRRQAAEMFEHYVSRYLLVGIGLFVAVVAWGVGSGAALQWEKYLWFSHPTPFGIVDPIFHQDIGFYVFKLPFWQYIWQWCYLTLFAVLIAAAAVHYLDKAIRVLGGVPAFAPHVKSHLSVIIGLILLAKAVGYYFFDRWSLLYSTRGATFGLSYTDAHIQAPILEWVMAPIAVICAIAVLVNIRVRGLWLPLVAIGVLVAVSVIGNSGLPAAMQRFQVQPNEFGKEQPYIESTIKFTRQAYQLDGIRERDMSQIAPLTSAGLAAQPEVVQNIRLWDPRSLQQTYKRLQELRPYYQFMDVDVDRYTLNQDYRQVMLAPRELAPKQVPEQTWQNLHLAYTHGYGLVLSPVNRVTPEGLPLMAVSDVPVQSTVSGLRIKRPEIYFGESDLDYSIVGTSVPEVDYPSGDRTVTTKYAGATGIPLASAAARTAAALRYGEINIFVSDAITAQSRLLMNRRVRDRARLIAPFLEYDDDPYLVVRDNGRLAWIHDAYTVTDRYPYSEPVPGGPGINYLRNAVKVVTDAYDGTITFYVSDPRDPIIRTYAKIFPGMLRPLDRMPADLRRHLRWPEAMFMLQTSMYAKYHMTDARTFYYQEDKWEIAAGAGSSEADADTPTRPDVSGGSAMEPYYIVTRLPEEQHTEFILMRPYTPAGKPNMVAWMCARADAPHYGELMVYRFPRDQTVFGPSLVGNRIEQNTDISAQLTLWRSRGSDVIRGNLLVIPVGKSLLYIEPLLLRAQDGGMPELKRVIVAVGQVGGNATVVMRDTLEEALNAALGGTELVAPPAPPTGGAPTAAARAAGPAVAAPQRELIKSAVSHYEAAQTRARAGDWAGYGKELSALGEDLRRLEGR